MRKKALLIPAVAVTLFGGTLAAQAAPTDGSDQESAKTEQPEKPGHTGKADKPAGESGGKAASAGAAKPVQQALVGAEPTGDTYAQYSRMLERSAGQFWADGAVAGQWSWNPQGGGESHIGWGHPDDWPPKSQEHFVREDGWVMQDGWGNDEVYYELQVEKEQIGDANCKNMRDLPVDEQGRQHYVRWKVPSEGYCLKAWGTIVQKPGDARIKYSHTQIWTPPHSCTNPHYGQETCIGQWESWWDDQDNPGKPIERKLERQIQLAKGVGMAFTIDQTVPHEWHANLKNHWTW